MPRNLIHSGRHYATVIVLACFVETKAVMGAQPNGD